MNFCKHSSLVAVVLIAFVTAARSEAAKTPGWIQAAMQKAIPSEFKDHEAVVIHHEMIHEYGFKKTYQRKNVRYAVKSQKLDGRDWASLTIYYNEANDRIRSLEIWIIPPTGKPVKKTIRDCLDILQVGYGSLNPENRVVLYPRLENIRPGSVFAYSYTIEEKSVFAENKFYFSSTIPFLESRLEVITPKGWDVSSQTLNDGDFLTQTRDEDRWIWTSQHVDALTEEEWSPGPLPTTLVSYTAVPRDGSKSGLFAWEDWNDVAIYTQENCRHPSAITPQIEAKAREITQPLSSSEDKIRALAKYVQEINYISVSLDISKGGGFIPRAATEVLETGFGDCKDKATILRALLEVIGIRSHQVIVNAYASHELEKSWPSPLQFNHCILAIETDAFPDSYSAIDHAELGRLLIFDPTQDLIPIGFLPSSLRGKSGIIGLDLENPMLEFPVGRAESNRIEKYATVVLTEEGDLKGTGNFIFSGNTSVGWRGLLTKLGDQDFHQKVTDYMGNNLGKARSWNPRTEDDFEAHRLTLDLEFESNNYGRSLNNELLIFQPALLGRYESIPPEDDNRINEITFFPRSHKERYEVTLPEGFVVDEKPEDVFIEGAFGSFTRTCFVEEGVLVYESEVITHSAVIPASEYETIREYYRQCVEAEKAPVVLTREEV